MPGFSCPFSSKIGLISVPFGLVHEHLIPRKIVREMLMNLKDPSPEAVNEIFDRFCVGVVITKTEDTRLNELGLNSNMPSNWDHKDLWARYHAAGIEISTQTEEAESGRNGD
jgi:hypothetical protein